MVDPVRDWLIAAYLSDPTPDRYRRPDGTWEPMVLITLAALADRIQALGLPLTATMDRCMAAGWIDDIRCDLTPTDTPVTPLPHSVVRLRLPPGRHRLVGIWRAVTVDSDAVAVPPVGTTQSEGGTPPDGPCGVDGLRYAGVEVRFGRAALQYRLVLALWDVTANRPSLPRPIEDVMTDVYGTDHDTEDAAFRRLLTDTRRRLQDANCPLDIRAANGQVMLAPL